MMPLRLLEVDPSPYPPPRHPKAALELSRAVTLMMLDPEALYYPLDIARIHYTWELLNQPDDEVLRQVNLLRKSLVQFAERNQLGSNPELKGAVWQSLLGSNLHQVAALMAALKKAQTEHPGTIFTLWDGGLVPYPDQNARLEPPRALIKTKGMQHFALAKSPPLPPTPPSTEGEAPPLTPAAPVPSMPDQAVFTVETAAPLLATPPPHKQEQAAASPVADEAPTRAPEIAVPQLPQRQTPSSRARGRGAWSAASRVLARCLMWLALLCPFLAGVNGFVVDEIYMDDISAIGAPFHEPAHFVVRGYRYKVGDRLRFEGQEGVVMKIDRYSLMIDDREYDTRTLYLLGGPILADGNYVVFPGDPRHVAGNFWIGDTSELEALEPGYVSWLGGFEGYPFHRCDAEEAGDFWMQVTGEVVIVHGNRKLVVPEGIQYQRFLSRSAALGARVFQTDRGVNIEWP